MHSMRLRLRLLLALLVLSGLLAGRLVGGAPGVAARAAAPVTDPLTGKASEAATPALPAGGADIRLGLIGPSTAHAGDFITYYIEVRNAGALTTSVALTDTFTSQVTWISTEWAPEVSCDSVPIGSNIRCIVPSLPPSPALLQAVTITMQINTNVPPGYVIVNLAWALSPDDPSGMKTDVVATTILAAPPINDDF